MKTPKRAFGLLLAAGLSLLTSAGYADKLVFKQSNSLRTQGDISNLQLGAGFASLNQLVFTANDFRWDMQQRADVSSTGFTLGATQLYLIRSLGDYNFSYRYVQSGSASQMVVQLEKTSDFLLSAGDLSAANGVGQAAYQGVSLEKLYGKAKIKLDSNLLPGQQLQALQLSYSDYPNASVLGSVIYAPGSSSALTHGAIFASAEGFLTMDKRFTLDGRCLINTHTQVLNAKAVFGLVGLMFP